MLGVGLVVLGWVSAIPVAADTQAPDETTLHARSVHRGLEEPGRYDLANLFDGDAETGYCSAPDGGAYVSLILSFADQAILSKVTGVRVTPSPTSGADRLTVSFLTGRPGSGEIEGAIAAKPETLGLTRVGNGGSPLTVEIRLLGGGPRRPICVADLAFQGSAGPLVLPGLAAAVKAAKARDAALARLTADRTAADRTAFARAYLTSFRWTYFNPHKETSTWESARYRFFADGTFEQTIAQPVDRIERTKGRWSLDGGGRLVGVQRRALPLRACPHRPGYLCLSDDGFHPDPSW